MIDFIQENLTLILSGGGIGAVVGAAVVALMNGAKNSGVLNPAMAGQLATMVGVVKKFRDGMGETQGGFDNIISMLDGDGAPSDARSDNNSVTDKASGLMTTAGASALISAVMALPGLPKMPDLFGEFEALKDHALIGPLMGQLQKVDTDGVNVMLEEFKSLVETTLKPAIDKAVEGGMDFSLEPETIKTLSQGAGEFVKVIGGMTGGLDEVLDKLTSMLD